LEEIKKLVVLSVVVCVCVCVHDDSSLSPHVVHKQTSGQAKHPDVCTPYQL